MLGDIPLLGWLFKTEQRSKSVQQLMIFMTPYLVRDSAQQRSVIEAELSRREPALRDEWERLAGVNGEDKPVVTGPFATPPGAPASGGSAPSTPGGKPTGPK
jgi:Flp pilus assembly secretin CpaC